MSNCSETNKPSDEEKTIAPDSLTAEAEKKDAVSEERVASTHKEDLTAWLQVLGAFCLNLNTW